MLSGPHDHDTFLPVPFRSPAAGGEPTARDSPGDRRLGEDLAVLTLSLAGYPARAVRRTRRLLAALTLARRQLHRREELHARFGRVDRAAPVPGNRMRDADTDRASVCLLQDPWARFPVVHPHTRRESGQLTHERLLGRRPTREPRAHHQTTATRATATAGVEDELPTTRG